MARALGRLSAVGLKSLEPGRRHADGGGLYASISKDGRSRRWVFLFRWKGTRSEMGLGGLDVVTLAEARRLAALYRLDLAQERNPLDERRKSVCAHNAVSGTRTTFGEIADELIRSKGPGWRNAKHRGQWAMTLSVYAAPLRSMPVAQIGTDHVRAVLEPIWLAKPETASRTRGRIEAVLDAARVRGFLPADSANPARWRGHLELLLAKQPPFVRGHHAALPWQDIPTFMSKLRARTGTSPLALQWCILTAARIGEALGTRWDEIDLKGAVWHCPADRMKAGKPHRVPLSGPALELLQSISTERNVEFVFPGAKRGQPLSNMVMKSLFTRMGYDTITTHGFRSTFRDWAGEATQHSREVCEAALAHAVGNSVEQAYRRGDAFEKRRALMNEWAAFCSQTGPGNSSGGGNV